MSQRLKVVPKVPSTITPKQVREWVESGESRSVIDVMVTPEIATVLLSYNRPGETNRNLSRSNVRTTTESLSRKNWINTGEPIIISDEAILNDGQHRLTGIIETGIPAVMDLRFGISRRAFAATNSGAKRTGGQALLGMGAINTNALAALLRVVLAYQDGMPQGLFSRISNIRILEASERWPEAQEALTILHRLPKPIANSTMAGLIFFALHSANRAIVDEFFLVVETGEGKASNPPHKLRETLISSVPKVNNGAHRAVQLAIGILAWNAFRNNEIIPGKLHWRVGQEYPKVDRLKL
jgi:hypothetical protein